MMRTLFFTITILLAGCSTGPVESERIRKVETSLIPPVRLDGDSLWTIESRMAYYGVPGVSIAVISDGQIAWTKAYGVMHKERKEPVTTTTLFQAGSISKPVAAYGALRIAASGKIMAEENVNTYLKSWKLPENEFTQKQPVHLKHLLSHTGGLTVHGFLGYSPDLPVPSVVQVLDGLPPANSPPVRVDKLPGDGFRYSGGGYTIMQLMLTDVEGKPFPDIMQEQVLGPLQMTHSTYEQPLPPDKLLIAATGYVPDGTMTKGERHTYPEMAAAGLWTTAEDLARFAIDIQRTFGGKDGPVLGAAAVREMLTPYHSEETGLGIFTENRSGEWYFGHGGWDEGFSAQLIAHRDKGYGVVVLTNSNHPPFIDELIRSVAMTYGWDQYVPRYTPLLHSPEDVKRIAGRYRYDSDGVSTVYEKEGKLYYQYTGWKPMRLYKVTDSTYARRERTALIQFMENSKDGSFHLVFRDGQDSARFEHPRMNEGEKVPYEWFVEGDFARAATAYAAFVKQNPEDRFINEGTLNRRGYDLLGEKKFSLAKEMFRINMTLYPSSANVYDSYAEACMKNGDTEEAIIFYKKTLTMQPDNPNAVKNLETLTKK